MLQVGDTAPDFELPVLIAGVKARFRLNEQRGKNLVLAFYPLNWESISAEQMVAYQVERDKFVDLNAEVVTVSVDSIMNTTSWEREIGPFDFPMCSDFWPHGEVSRRYGVFREEGPMRGAAERAVFVIDRSGKIRSSRNYSLRELPAAEDALLVLRTLNS
ncbi:MAG TPA: redoxin domain-containing protein [Terriglobales bacterium]|nr:redoxin domain-containing protein [Terriglobales bacterium]